MVALAQRLRERLDSVAKVPVWSMRPEEQREALTTLAQAKAQLHALELRVLAEADRETRADLRLAQALERHDVLFAAMSAGRVNTDQARAIVWPSTGCPRQAITH